MNAALNIYFTDKNLSFQACRVTHGTKYMADSDGPHHPHFIVTQE